MISVYMTIHALSFRELYIYTSIHLYIDTSIHLYIHAYMRIDVCIYIYLEAELSFSLYTYNISHTYMYTLHLHILLQYQWDFMSTWDAHGGTLIYGMKSLNIQPYLSGLQKAIQRGML